MSVVQLFLAIAADLKSKDRSKLATDFAALLIALSKASDKPPVMEAAKMCSATPDGAFDAAGVASEIEATFGGADNEAKMKAGALPWASILALLLKILPFVIGGGQS